MGNPKQKWTSEEEEALRAGVAKHGTGKWKNIQKDPEFNHFLYSRSNIDLKDKWRNMSVSANGQGSREKIRTPKAKANPDAPATPLPIALTAASTAPVVNDTTADAVMDDSSKCLLDGNIASNTTDRGDAARPAEEMQLDGRVRSTSTAYNGLIYEALSALKNPNGSDTNAIINFIEQRQEILPQNFRRLLSSRLRRLVAQDKLEKVQNCYKIKRDVLLGAKTPIPKPKDVRPRQSPTTGYLGDTIEEAAVTAAYKVAEAENKSLIAAEAVKEAERVLKMAEDADSLLQLAKEIYEKCSRGEIVLMA